MADGVRTCRPLRRLIGRMQWRVAEAALEREVMARILAGKAVVEKMADDIKERIASLAERGVTPTLAIVRVGERPDDLSYERTALRRAEALGVAVRSVVLAADATEDELACAIERVNADASIHGCLLFRPLPKSMNETRICDMLAVEKDIDGIARTSLAGVFTDDPTVFPPSTAQACLEVLDAYGIDVAGKHVVVIGRSLVVGKPVAMMLLGRHASVTICHSRTERLDEICREADIVICATGRARAFGATYFRAGQTVLDVGINFDEAGKLCGDVDYEAVEPLVGAITPVPGGVGSVTTSVTMMHTVRAAERAAR